ncbi:TonB C-terminal domain-containing protein [bacterium]|nr:TonB C-terminal domain-containing protein [bacterium]
MKKIILLSTAILLSVLNAYGADWQPLDIKTKNVSACFDADSVKILNANEYYYTVRYQALGQSEKIAYIKANSKTNYIGIIQAGEYDPDTYRPNAVFDNPHTFMKPVREDSFLYEINNAVATIAGDKYIAENSNYDKELQLVLRNNSKSGLKNDLPVSYIRTKDAKDVMTPAALETFLFQTSNLLKKNWHAPATGSGTKTVVVATIGVDGSLLNYKIVDSSNNDTNDRSVAAALEKTVTYPEFDATGISADALNFQFIFVNGFFKKSVIY